MIPIYKLSGRLGNQMFRHAYIYSQMRDGVIPDEFVQDYKYFEKYSEEIKRLFGSDILFQPYVGIHIRRGDYVNNPFYVDLTKTDYYIRAMAEFPNESFMIFSDDIEWCKKNMPRSMYFCEEKDDVKSMNLLAGCKGIIMANSSFSWWASFISPFASKIVAPKEWYSDKIERTKCLDNWIRI
jgi:hypothetical protein